MHVPWCCTLSKGPSWAWGHALLNTSPTHTHSYTHSHFHIHTQLGKSLLQGLAKQRHTHIHTPGFALTRWWGHSRQELIQKFSWTHNLAQILLYIHTWCMNFNLQKWKTWAYEPFFVLQSLLFSKQHLQGLLPLVMKKMQQKLVLVVFVCELCDELCQGD